MAQKGDKDSLVEAAVGQSLEKISLGQCTDLWKRLSRGELGSGDRVRAVQRSLAGRLNHHRSDHVRRLFLTMFDPVMQRDRLFVDGTAKVPGVLHMIDLGATWLALRDEAIGKLADEVQQWLVYQAESQPIFEVIGTEAAQNYRAELRDAAIAALEARWRKQKSLDKFLKTVGQYRLDAAQSAYGERMQLISFKQGDLAQLIVALKMERSLREHAQQLSCSPEVPADAVAEQIREQLPDLRKAAPEGSEGQAPWLLPALAGIHRHRRADVIGVLLPDVSQHEQTVLSDVAVGHHYIAAERLRRFFDEGWSGDELSQEHMDRLADDLTVLQDTTALADRDEFRASGQARRRLITLTRHVREVAVERGAEAASHRVEQLLENPRLDDDTYIGTRRLLGLVHALGMLRASDLQESKTYTNWRANQLKRLHQTFSHSAQDLRGRDLPGYLARLVSLGGALEGEVDEWVRVISYPLVLGATRYLQEQARLPGETTRQEAEALTLQIVSMVSQELRQTSNIQGSDIRALRQAAETWATRNGQDLSQILQPPKDVDPANPDS